MTGNEAIPADGDTKGTVFLLTFVPVRVPSVQSRNGVLAWCQWRVIDTFSCLGMPLFGHLSSGTWWLYLLSSATPAGDGDDGDAGIE